MVELLTVAQAQAILSHYLEGEAEVSRIERIRSEDIIRDNTTQIYLLHLTSEGPSTYLIKIAPSSSPNTPPRSYAPNSLSTEHTLLHTLASLHPPLPLPIPTPIALSPTPNALLPHPYLLLSRPHGTPLPSFNDPAAAQAGHFLHALHAIDTDFFGRPDTPEAERLLSWQDTFVLALEEALEDVPSSALSTADVARVRMALGRAIGAYAFEDVEVPALVAFTASAPESFLVDEDGQVVCALAQGLPRAVWGDTLLERAFVRPAQALMDAYVGKPEGEVVVVKRQAVKMVWYELYAAVVVLAEGAQGGAGNGWDEEVEKEGRLMWAKEEVTRCLERLEQLSVY